MLIAVMYMLAQGFPKAVDLFDLSPYDFNGVALVGAVVCIKDVLVFADQHQLGGGTSAVNAQVCLSAVGGNVDNGNACLVVTCLEGSVLSFVCKERR